MPTFNAHGHAPSSAAHERSRVDLPGEETVMEYLWIPGMLIFAAAAILVVVAFIRVKQRDKHYYETGELEE